MKLPAVDRGRFRIGSVKVNVEHVADRADVEVRAVLSVAHLEDPDDRFASTVFRERASLELFSNSKAFRRQLVRSAIVHAVTHEIDEWLKIDGEQATDPHPELKARTA